MTTSATKTRALCVATRCTSVDQFVATFHRFCDDDQTFFVATMTSRPVGLETAFSIQLADKQPVLRGLCVVLDAWATPENRYKRPGIRLGIKRLTPDSQIVFDRLRAAAKGPAAVAEATPPPGPLPVPPIPPIAPALRPPAFALRTSGSPPPLPRLNMPPVSVPPVRAQTVTASPPPVFARGGAPEAEPPPAGVEVRAPAPSPTFQPEPPPASPVEPGPDALDPEPSSAPESDPSPEPIASPEPSPVAVTRFQVALKVGTIPPPVSEVEFKPTPLLPRPRTESKIVSEPSPDETPVEPGSPAVIVDRPGEPPALPTRDTVPELAAVEPPARAPDPAPGADLRTPGSALVLPANPLQDLSDESLEGFVDCTLYEETLSLFPPDGDGGEEADEVAEPPAARVTPAAAPASLPAMPFDTPPNLTVRTQGHSESLAVAPDEPPPVMAPPEAPVFALTSTAALFAPLPDERAASYPPWPGAPNATYGSPFVSESSHPEAGAMPADTMAALTVHGHANAGQRLAPDPLAEAMHYPAYPVASSVVSLEMLPEMPRQIAPAWQRWLAIVGAATVAVVLAFVVARLVRGSDRQAPVAATTTTTAAAAAAAAAPRAPSPPSSPVAPAGSGSDATRTADQGSKAVAAAPAGSAEPPPEPASGEDDGEAVSGGTPVVGSGPCRVTVATTPAGSSVRLDDQTMGPSPLTIDGTCDRHKIEVSHARYQTVTRSLTLTPGKPQQLDLSLPRPVHAVTVTSSPSGAELSIDGHRAGTTPTVVQMVGFATVNLTFTKAGFQTVTKKVYSKLPQDRVFVKLVR